MKKNITKMILSALLLIASIWLITVKIDIRSHSLAMQVLVWGMQKMITVVVPLYFTGVAIKLLESLIPREPRSSKYYYTRTWLAQ